jgi:hypothetical protein
MQSEIGGGTIFGEDFFVAKFLIEVAESLICEECKSGIIGRPISEDEKFYCLDCFKKRYQGIKFPSFPFLDEVPTDVELVKIACSPDLMYLLAMGFAATEIKLKFFVKIGDWDKEKGCQRSFEEHNVVVNHEAVLSHEVQLFPGKTEEELDELRK